MLYSFAVACGALRERNARLYVEGLGPGERPQGTLFFFVTNFEISNFVFGDEKYKTRLVSPMSRYELILTVIAKFFQQFDFFLLQLNLQVCLAYGNFTAESDFFDMVDAYKVANGRTTLRTFNFTKFPLITEKIENSVLGFA